MQTSTSLKYHLLPIKMIELTTALLPLLNRFEQGLSHLDPSYLKKLPYIENLAQEYNIASEELARFVQKLSVNSQKARGDAKTGPQLTGRIGVSLKREGRNIMARAKRFSVEELSWMQDYFKNNKDKVSQDYMKICNNALRNKFL